MRFKTLLALTLVAGGAHANLLTNGSFESLGSYTDPFGARFPYYANGSTGLPGWTAIGDVHNIDQTGITPQASDGQYFMDLTGETGYDKGIRSNAFSTVANQQYTLSFDLGGLTAQTFGNVSVQVQVNGVSVPSLFVNNGLPATCSPWPTCGVNWKSFSYTFTAPTASTTVSFLGRANGADSNLNGILLDNVSVVPEPEAYVLALAALVVLGVSRKAARHPGRRDV